MVTYINSLFEVLNEEKNIYQNLFELSEQKTEIVINNQIRELDEIVDKEQKLLRILNGAEVRRLDIHSKIAEIKGIAPEQLTISGILMESDIAVRTQYHDLIKEITELLERQKEVNQKNQSLLRNNLNYISGVIERIVAGNKEESTYDNSGRREIKQRRNIIDQSL